MDQNLRNALRRNVNALRELLYESALEQLEGNFGVEPSGNIQPDDKVPPLRENPELHRRRDEIVAALKHMELKLSGKEAVTQRAVEMFALEAAYTLLNRLAALKLLERRQLVPECVSRGPESEGFNTFREISPTLGRGLDIGSYQRFLELLFDDVGEEVKLLFDRTLPPSHLFPDEATLKEALARLNEPEIDAAWAEDETLGWVYQYFTPEWLRKEIREESPAPRDSYELAIRNQFYTPDYVVRFLSENTLGRLWWEMNPETEIKNRDFLVYRQGENPKSRAPKDPREIRVLDPACGSGHFLHYSFDLLQIIYREAYDGHPAGNSLREEYPDREEFERAIPGLILYHNLYGIDIDLRAVQLTALTLYLRAKRASPECEIRRVNAIHAAPMPGEQNLFEEFLATLESESHASLIKRLLQRIWAELDELAAEAGSLLKVEETIGQTIHDMKEKLDSAEVQQLSLAGLSTTTYEQAELSLDQIPTEQFWRQLEKQLVTLLRRYAETVRDDGVARRLFAEDAAHGFAFVDSQIQKYDVVLMNPPFGAASKPSKKYVDKAYPRTKNDLYAAFVERALELLHRGGYVGAITSRTGFFLSSFQKWREEILLKETEIIAFADLGAGVLDTAMVETAAYALEKVT